MAKRRARIETVTIETATLRAHARQVIGETGTLARRLEHAAASVAESVTALSVGSGAEELRGAATEMRAVAAFVMVRIPGIVITQIATS
jgi:hypothetical protein